MLETIRRPGGGTGTRTASSGETTRAGPHSGPTRSANWRGRVHHPQLGERPHHPQGRSLRPSRHLPGPRPSATEFSHVRPTEGISPAPWDQSGRRGQPVGSRSEDMVGVGGRKKNTEPEQASRTRETSRRAQANGSMIDPSGKGPHRRFESGPRMQPVTAGVLRQDSRGAYCDCWPSGASSTRRAMLSSGQ